jgi:1-acyl-sn-glycerol-3-phosphate acyltransferase
MNAAPRSESRLPDWLVQNRNFMLLWAAYGISAFGDHLSEMALLKTGGGVARDDSTRLQALMTFCFFAPFVVCGPVAGWWADRFSRKWTMIAADLVRAAIVFSIPLYLALGFVQPRLASGAGAADFLVALPLALTGAFAAFFSPARQAMVPTLIRDDQLVRANAMINALGTIGGILSAWLGGILVDWALARRSDLHWNYWLDGLTFLLSAVLLLGIRMSRTRAVPHALATGLLTPIREGFEYVRTHRRIFQVILLATVFWATAGVVVSVVPAIVRDVFGGTFQDIGLYRGLLAAGLALGAALLTIIGAALPLPIGVLASVSGAGCWILVLAATVLWKWGRVPTALCLLMLGLHGAGILVSIMVVIQRFVPDGRRGRVFGVSDMTTMAAIVAATGVLGLPHIPHLDQHIPWLLALCGGGLLTATVLAWRIYRRGDPLPPASWLLWRLVWLYAGFWCRVRRVGPCTVPRTGPVLVAANHTSGVDPLVILGTCRTRLVSFVVEQRYYRVPLANWFMRQAACIPVNRENPGKSFLTASLRHLKAGGCLGIFPQGTYAAPDEPIPPAKAGIGTLALRTGAVVIPCHISGAAYRFNPFRSLFLRHRVRVRFGPPVDLSVFAGHERDPDAPQQASQRIMAAVWALADDPARHDSAAAAE